MHRFSSGFWVKRKVYLRIVGIEVNVQAMLSYYVCKGCSVQRVHDRTEHRTFGDTVEKLSTGGVLICHVDKLGAVRQVERLPGQGLCGDSETMFTSTE